MKSGVLLITEERKRQQEKEGWTPEHDDHHRPGVLATAGACYAEHAAKTLEMRGIDFSADDDGVPYNWPFHSSWWRPTPADQVRQLAKAGALIAAEIDKIQRGKG